MQIKEAIDRFMEALIKRVEGTKDIKKKLDYLAHPQWIETMSILNPAQLDAIVGMIQIGEMYPETLSPLKEFAIRYATWSPSKDGKRSEDLVKVMMQVAPETPQSVTTIHTGSPKGEAENENK